MSMSEDKYRTSTFQYQPIDQAQNIANKRRIIDIMQQMVNTPLAGVPRAGVTRVGEVANTSAPLLWRYRVRLWVAVPV